MKRATNNKNNKNNTNETNETTNVDETEYFSSETDSEYYSESDESNISTIEGGDGDKDIDENIEEDNEGDDIDEENEEDENEEDDNEDKEDEKEDNEDEEEEFDEEEGCVYKGVSKKNKSNDLMLENKLDNINNYFGEEDTELEINKFVEKDKRITKPYLTKYERVRLLGDRARQLSLGAKPLIKNVDNLGPKEIAKLELEHKIMPLYVIRPLPNGFKEKWYLHELQIIN